MKTLIQTPTPNLELSKTFYSKLGFNLQQSNDKHFAVSKDLIIEINIDRPSRAGLKLIQPSWDSFLKDSQLNKSITKTSTGYLLTSPSGCCVYLETEFPMNDLKGSENIIPGTFAGLTLETNEIEKSIVFWKALGFNQNAGNIEHGWISLSNEFGFSISLMKYQICPHLFFNPSLSFFNGKENLSIISQIKNLEIPITEEITHFNNEGIVDNIIIKDPGGLGYFIFSD